MIEVHILPLQRDGFSTPCTRGEEEVEEWSEPRLVLADHVQQRLDLGAAPGVSAKR
jgi:hypothetical protein